MTMKKKYKHEEYFCKFCGAQAVAPVLATPPWDVNHWCCVECDSTFSESEYENLASVIEQHSRSLDELSNRIPNESNDRIAPPALLAHCCCGSETLILSQMDHDEFELAIFTNRKNTFTWKDKFRWIAQIIFKGDPFGDQMILRKKDIKDMHFRLSKFL